MKKNSSIFVSILLLVVMLLTSACGANAYNAVKEYVDDMSSKGDHSCYLFLAEEMMLVSYDVDSIMFTSLFSDSTIGMTISISEDSSTFFYYLKYDNEYTMQGELVKSNITKNTSVLAYESSTAPSILRPTLSELAATVLKLLLYNINKNLEPIDVTVNDLGFTNW